MDGATSATPVREPKRSTKTVVALALFLLAIGLAVAAVYASGGVSYLADVASKIGSGTLFGAAPVASTVPTTTAGADSSATAFGDEAAKRVYVEQIESQVNLERLASGDIASISVKNVSAGDTRTVVNIQAKMADGTNAAGAIVFVKQGSLWYLVSLTGLRDTSTGGLADSVGAAKQVEPSATVAAEFAAAGVKVPDPDVLRAITEQQVLNQPLVSSLLSGEYTQYVFGKPSAGSGTVTIPITIKGTGESDTSATAIMIRKKVEGQDRIFLTTMKLG
jgi:hypothetical protein